MEAPAPLRDLTLQDTPCESNYVFSFNGKTNYGHAFNWANVNLIMVFITSGKTFCSTIPQSGPSQGQTRVGRRLRDTGLTRVVWDKL